MNAPSEFSVSGGTTKRASNTPKSENMGTKFWQGGKNADALVSLAIGASWATISTSTVKMPSVQNCGMHVGLEVSLLVRRRTVYSRVLYSRSSDIQFESAVASVKAFAI